MSSMYEGASVPGTVFTGDSDLCKMLLAFRPNMRAVMGWRVARMW